MLFRSVPMGSIINLQKAAVQEVAVRELELVEAEKAARSAAAKARLAEVRSTVEEMAQKHGIEAKQLFENLAARDMVLMIEVCSAVADFGLLMPCASLYLGVFESAINAGLSVRLVLGATHCSHPPRHLCCRWVRF